MNKKPNIDKFYQGIEDWTYKNIIKDFLGDTSQEVRKGSSGMGDPFHIIHHGSCTIDLTYYNHRHKAMIVRIFGDETNSKNIAESLDKKIAEYNQEYCDPVGLRNSVHLKM